MFSALKIAGMEVMLTKDAERLAGSRKALCSLLGITSPAVSQWGGVLPEARMWQLKALRPDWFIPSSAPQPKTEAGEEA